MAVSFKFPAGERQSLSFAQRRASDLCCVYLWLQSAISPFWGTCCICMYEDCHSAARQGAHITVPIFTSGAQLTHWQHFKRLQPRYSSEITQLFNYHLNLWSPATRFLGGRHGNLKLPLGSRESVRRENNFKKSSKRRFGPQCGPAPDNRGLTPLCSFCAAF